VNDASPIQLADHSVNAAGILASAREYSLLSGDGSRWRGLNGKWYSTSWAGNQFAGSRNLVLSTARAANVAGKIFFVGGAAVSTYQFVSALANNNPRAASAAMINIIVSGYGVWGGPPGAVFAAGYWLGTLGP